MNDRPARILIIDDEEDLRLNLAAYFEDEGFDVTEAGSGEEAVEILRDQSFDAAVVDMRLPGIDGNATILAAHEIRPETLFVIHTGSLAYVLPDEIRALGFDESRVFNKPLPDMCVLVERVRALLQGSAAT